MKTVAALLIVSCLFLGAAAVDAAKFEIYGGPGYMNWEEYTALSRRKPYVGESGIMHTVGAGYSSYFTENLFSQLKLEGFGGQIDYQGSHIVDRSPCNISGVWLGATLEETVGYRIKIQKDLSLAPFFSLGASILQRGVCRETWYVGYSRLGIEVEKEKFFARVGILFPFYTEAHGSWQGIFWVNNGQKTEITTQPKGTLTPFAEIGFQQGRWKFSLSGEIRKWNESDWVEVDRGIYAFQPETVQKFFSIKIGVNF